MRRSINDITFILYNTSFVRPLAYLGLKGAVDNLSGLGYSSEVSHFQWFVWNYGGAAATVARRGVPNGGRRIEALWESGV